FAPPQAKPTTFPAAVAATTMKSPTGKTSSRVRRQLALLSASENFRHTSGTRPRKACSLAAINTWARASASLATTSRKVISGVISRGEYQRLALGSRHQQQAAAHQFKGFNRFQMRHKDS